MRSIQLVATRQLEPRPLPDPPDPKAGELLVKVRAVGLCGSDLHWFVDGRIGRNNANFPQILGHEPLVEVMRAGAGVTDFKEGDRLSVEPTISCGHCEYCLAGFHNNCVTNHFMGGPQAFGFFREYAVIPAHNATHVPDQLTDRQATLIEPVAVMAHMIDLAQIKPGDTVGVTGAGPIGMLCAAIAKTSGASKIFICDRQQYRLEMAMRMGATMATDTDTFPELIRDETRGRGVDVTLEASGAVQAINTCLAVTRPTGTVVLIGLTSEAEAVINIHDAMGKELSIRTIKRSNHCADRAIRLLKSGAIPDLLITHSLPLEKTPEAFQMASTYSDNCGKIVIEASR